jgi:YbbR domain-containing protein
MAESAHQGGGWRRNLGARALALALAIFVWSAIREATSYDTVVEDVPIIVRCDEGLALLDLSDESTDVRFRGTWTDIRDLSRDQVQVVVDVRGHSIEGPQTVAIGPENVRGPRGPRPVSLRVNRISFSLDHEVEKQVPVKVELQGSPPPGFEVERVMCTPAVVTLLGPSSRLENVEVVRTAPVELEGRTQSFKIRRAILPPGPGWAARVNPDRVWIEVTVIEQSATWVIEDVPLRVVVDVDSREVVGLSPRVVDVTVQGRGESLPGLDATALIAFVEALNLTAPGQYELPVRVYTAAPVRVLSVSPASAAVEWRAPVRP